MLKTVLTGLLAAATSLTGGIASAGEVVLFDFESGGGKFENADKLQYVAQHATQGKKAGRASLERHFDLNFAFWGGSNMAGRWGEFDQFVIDVFIEGGPVACVGFVNDTGNRGWWKRYNYEFTLSPGKRRLTFSLGALVRQRTHKPLDLGKLDFFAVRFKSARAGVAPTIYLDNARLVKGTGSFEVRVLYSFEGKDEGTYELEDWPPDFKGTSSMAVVAEHASDGEKALRLASGAPAGNVQFSGFESDWSRYDKMAIDVFSAADRPVKVSGWIKPSSKAAGWWNRHNWQRVLKPGFNSVKLSLGGMTNARNDPLDLTRIAAFNVAVDRQIIFVDNFRLVKGVEEVPVEGIRKFDFGPPNSATMPGFTRVSKETKYDETKGFGWLPRANMGRDFDIMEMLGRHRPPDDLCRDFCQPIRATFAVDVPKGVYRVWLMLGPPGNGWGAHFKQRTVRAEGVVTLDEKYTVESFRDHEFQFQDEEDLPGDDLWEKYIDKLFRPKVFDVTVQDGQLTLSFDSHGAWWCSHLNGLVVSPNRRRRPGPDGWLTWMTRARSNTTRCTSRTSPDRPLPMMAQRRVIRTRTSTRPGTPRGHGATSASSTHRTVTSRSTLSPRARRPERLSTSSPRRESTRTAASVSTRSETAAR